VTDVNGDGFDDLLLTDATGKLRLLANRAGRFKETALSVPNAGQTFSALTSAWLSTPGNLDLLGFTAFPHTRKAAEKNHSNRADYRRPPILPTDFVHHGVAIATNVTRPSKP